MPPTYRRLLESFHSPSPSPNRLIPEYLQPPGNVHTVYRLLYAACMPDDGAGYDRDARLIHSVMGSVGHRPPVLTCTSSFLSSSIRTAIGYKESSPSAPAMSIPATASSSSPTLGLLPLWNIQGRRGEPNTGSDATATAAQSHALITTGSPRSEL